MTYSARRALIEKQHTCIGCGCVFRYAVNLADWRTKMMSPTMRPRDSIRVHPCPDCGLYQPEMVMWLKVYHPILTLLALVVILVLAGIGLASGGTHAVLAAQIGVGVFLALALVHLATVFHDPNADRQANLAVAKEELKDRRLERVLEGVAGSGVRPPANFNSWHVPGLIALLAGPAAFVLVIIQLSDQPAPPSNPDIRPRVVKPGDRVYFTFKSSTAQGVSGTLWRGTPTVRVQNARSLGIAETLPAEGSTQTWGERVSVRKGAGNQSIQPTISFTLPRDEKLAGQTLRLAVTMPMTFPVMQKGGWYGGTKYFTDTTATVSETLVVKLADPGMVRTAANIFLVGLAGAAVSLLGGVWLTGLAWALLRRASHSEVVTDDTPVSAEPCPEPTVPGMVDHPVLDDFDRSMWGNRKLR
jgi:hypothetical protein